MCGPVCRHEPATLDSALLVPCLGLIAIASLALVIACHLAADVLCGMHAQLAQQFLQGLHSSLVYLLSKTVKPLLSACGPVGCGH